MQVRAYIPSVSHDPVVRTSPPFHNKSDVLGDYTATFISERLYNLSLLLAISQITGTYVGLD